MHVLLRMLHVLRGNAFVAGCALAWARLAWKLCLPCLAAAGSRCYQQLVGGCGLPSWARSVELALADLDCEAGVWAVPQSLDDL